MRSHRLVHYLVLAVVHGALTLPNLGAHSLWDMDEGVNAECTREMMESGSWIVPTFNVVPRSRSVIAWSSSTTFAISTIADAPAVGSSPACAGRGRAGRTCPKGPP